MKEKSRVWAALALAAVMVLTLAGCGGFQQPTAGSVTVSLANVQARSITPPISMAVVDYLVSATGPSGATIPQTVVSGTHTFEGLLPGEWTFNAIGRNDAEVQIGAGSGVITVVIGQTKPLSIVVSEYTGTGSLDLSLGWEPDIVDFPVFAGKLTDAAAVETPMAFTTDEVLCTAASLTAGLHEGWYACLVKLFDAPDGLDGNEVLSTGFATAARIAAGYTSAGSVYLHAVQGFGQVELLFENRFHDELQGLAGTPAFGDKIIYSGQSIIFDVSASEACTDVYYLRGQQVGTGSYTVDSEDLLLGGGVYRLDVVAFSLDGQRASSGTWEVHHEPPPPEAYDMHLQLGGMGAPVTATIYLCDSSWGTLQTFSAQTGGYSNVILLEAASYYVWAEAPGFASRYATNLDSAGTTVQGDATLFVIPCSPSGAWAGFYFSN